MQEPNVYIITYSCWEAILVSAYTKFTVAVSKYLWSSHLLQSADYLAEKIYPWLLLRLPPPRQEPNAEPFIETWIWLLGTSVTPRLPIALPHRFGLAVTRVAVRACSEPLGLRLGEMSPAKSPLLSGERWVPSAGLGDPTSSPMSNIWSSPARCGWEEKE